LIYNKKVKRLIINLIRIKFHVMKKSKSIELSWDDTQKLITLAQEERNPYEIIKKELGIDEKQVLEIMKKKLSADKFEIWKKKANAAKPKPKPIKIDEFDEDLDGKYYIKNKLD
jgi:uncharacterized protein (TIGR03643 family)